MLTKQQKQPQHLTEKYKNREFHLQINGIYVYVSFVLEGLNAFNYVLNCENNEVIIHVLPIINGETADPVIEEFTIPIAVPHRLVQQKVEDGVLQLTFMKDFKAVENLQEAQYAQTA